MFDEMQITADSWQALPDMPIEKWEAATFLLDDRLYVLGGYTTHVRTSRTAHYFDAADESWTRIQDLPSAISHVNVVLDGRVAWYAGGFKDGYKDHIVAEVWNYNVDLDGPVERGRFTAGPLLPEKRGGGGLALFDRNLHFFSGLKDDRDTDAAEHWVMDLDEYAAGVARWRDASPVPVPRNQFSTVQRGGKFYLIGGQFHHDSCQLDQARVDLYDPATDTWHESEPLPYGHSHSEGSTFVHDDLIYMIGGHFTPADGHKRIDRDILRCGQDGEWKVIGKLPVALSSPASRIIDGKLYVAGGSLDGGSVQSKVWVTRAP